MEKKIVTISIVITAFSVWFLSFYLGRYQTGDLLPINPIEKIKPEIQEPNVLRIRNLSCRSLKIGSGFLINPTTIVTNRHVVERARELEITDSSGKSIKYTAALISPSRDLAFIKTKSPLDPISIGRAGETGSVVQVIGYPLGRAIKKISGPIVANDQGRFLIDAKVIPGNSGGPVILRDEVIGVISKSAGSQAIAISINEVLRAERSTLKKPKSNC